MDRRLARPLLRLPPPSATVSEREKERDRHSLSQNVSARGHGPGSGVLAQTSMTRIIEENGNGPSHTWIVRRVFSEYAGYDN